MQSHVIDANILVHTRMADSYDRCEPHFRPENVRVVREILKQLRERTQGGRLLDLGCGTGFIINLVKDIYDEVHGVDVTPAMLERVDVSSGNITLHEGPAEQLPFDRECFDVVTAYSFLHHTADYAEVLREAARVLKPNGILYVDLEPNKLFWDAMTELDGFDADLLSPMLVQARDSVLRVDAKVEEEYGIARETFQLAEYSKSKLGGIDPILVRDQTTELGFKTCELTYQWYLGQGNVMHSQSVDDAKTVEEYLRAIGPVSNRLFKYLRLILTK